MKKLFSSPQFFAALGALWMAVAALLADRIEFVAFGGAGACFVAAICICIENSRSP